MKKTLHHLSALILGALLLGLLSACGETTSSTTPTPIAAPSGQTTPAKQTPGGKLPDAVLTTAPGLDAAPVQTNGPAALPVQTGEPAPIDNR